MLKADVVRNILDFCKISRSILYTENVWHIILMAVNGNKKSSNHFRTSGLYIDRIFYHPLKFRSGENSLNTTWSFTDNNSVFSEDLLNLLKNILPQWVVSPWLFEKWKTLPHALSYTSASHYIWTLIPPPTYWCNFFEPEIAGLKIVRVNAAEAGKAKLTFE